jgi:hypothetical protein
MVRASRFTLVSEADLAPSTVNRDAHCRKRASLHFRFWHIASLRCAAGFNRYRDIADIDEAAPIKLDL